MDFTHPVVDPFQQLACRRYPSNTRAILALKRLGQPPTSPDLDNPSPDVRMALQILAAFTCTITADSMGSSFGNLRPHTPTETAVPAGKNWASSVGLWVQMFMDKFILEHKDFTVPSGFEGRDFLDIILHVLPSLLIYPMKHPDERAAIRGLRSISPQFTKLAIQAMLTTIETNHFSWTSWSYALTNILFFHDRDPGDTFSSPSFIDIANEEHPRAGFGLPSNSDTAFVQALFQKYIGRAVYDALNKHPGRDGNISDSDNLSESGFKAIVVLDFCRPDFMSLKSLGIADVETVATDDRIQRLGGLGDHIRHCYWQNVSGNLVVATFFPSVGRGLGIPWCHVCTVLEPDYASDSDGDV
ncbi:hypothetical protein VNI00_013965 [Paramarasmius palmivorus]|uniref:Uncharacterized protein n=1 Tax=Paramarasmius palmivorus TaxID=297713 RepID=A0AAW0BVP4_9AGAR